jgi:hypothetical protein
MTRKFACVSAFRIAQSMVLMTILAGAATVQSQQTPAQSPSEQQPQQPSGQSSSNPQSSNQQSGSQEASPEETANPHHKPKDYKNWSYNAGGGASMTSGTTNKFVRSGGGIAAAGVARNYSKYFGFRLDFQFDNLPLRDSALQAAQAPGANDHVYSLMLDPIINVPVNKDWGGYVVFGPSYYHRSGMLDSSSAIPGSACNPFFTWWGHCFDSSLPLNGHFLNSSQDEFGENFGGGVTRKIRPNIDFYAEFRLMHGSHNGNTTDLKPITIGLRW